MAARNRYPDAILAEPGLLGYWRLNDPVGAAGAADLVAARTAAPVGGPTRGVAGLIANAGAGDTATRFDGIDDRVDVPFAAALNPAAYTYELLLRPLAIPITFDRNVLNNRAGGRGITLAASVGDGHLYWVHTKVGGGLDLRTLGTVPVASTGHVAATYDGTTVRVYRDGKHVANSGAVTYVPQTVNALSIGAAGYNATVAEVAIYNRALSRPTIALHDRLAKGLERHPSGPGATTHTFTPKAGLNPTLDGSIGTPGGLLDLGDAIAAGGVITRDADVAGRLRGLGIFTEAIT